jgi:hypothetical protein
LRNDFRMAAAEIQLLLDELSQAASDGFVGLSVIGTPINGGSRSPPVGSPHSPIWVITSQLKQFERASLAWCAKRDDLINGGS